MKNPCASARLMLAGALGLSTTAGLCAEVERLPRGPGVEHAKDLPANGLRGERLRLCVGLDEQSRELSATLHSMEAEVTEAELRYKHGREIVETTEHTLDTTDADAVRRYNENIIEESARVKRYNALLPAFNAQVERHNVVVDAFNEKCAGRSYVIKEWLHEVGRQTAPEAAAR